MSAVASPRKHSFRMIPPSGHFLVPFGQHLVLPTIHSLHGLPLPYWLYEGTSRQPHQRLLLLCAILSSWVPEWDSNCVNWCINWSTFESSRVLLITAVGLGYYNNYHTLGGFKDGRKLLLRVLEDRALRSRLCQIWCLGLVLMCGCLLAIFSHKGPLSSGTLS